MINLHLIHVAELGLEPASSGSAVRCAKGPGMSKHEIASLQTNEYVGPHEKDCEI